MGMKGMDILKNWKLVLTLLLPFVIMYLAFVHGSCTSKIYKYAGSLGRESQVLYVIILMMFYNTICFPKMGVIGFLPLALLPLMIVGKTKDFAGFYMKDNNMSFLATATIGIALGCTQLQMRFVYLIMALNGVNLVSIMLTVMWTTVILSAFITSSAATLIMIPVAMLLKSEIVLCLLNDDLASAGASLPRNLSRKLFFTRKFDSGTMDLGKPEEMEQPEEKKIEEPLDSVDNTMVEVDLTEPTSLESTVEGSQAMDSEDGDDLEKDEKNPLTKGQYQVRNSIFAVEEFDRLLGKSKNMLHPEDEKSLMKFEESLMQAIAIAANIGGILFPYSTLVSDSLYYPVAAKERQTLSLRYWFVYTFPIFLLSIIVLSHLQVLLTFSLQSNWKFAILRCGLRQKNQPTQAKGIIVAKDPQINEKVKAIMWQKYKDLGSFRFRESCVAVILTLGAFLFFFRDPRFMNGWTYAVLAMNRSPEILRTSCVAMAFLVLFFIIPKNIKEVFNPSEDYVYEPLIQWKLIQNRVPWGIILWIGGNTCLFEAAERSYFNDSVATYMYHIFHAFPKEVLLAIVLVITSLLCQLIGNVATTGIAVPILAKYSCLIGIHPFYFTLPVTISNILSFALPISSIPYAIMYHLQKISVSRMIKNGIIPNIFCIIIIYALHITYAEGIFGFSKLEGQHPLPLNISLELAHRCLQRAAAECPLYSHKGYGFHYPDDLHPEKKT